MTTPQLTITCLDLEGVLIPEVWIGLANKTGIEELKLTTRDIKDYNELMTMRLSVLDKHGLTLADVEKVVETMDPLEGAREFLDWLRIRTEVIILTDTFREFALPLIAKLGHPTMFCHSLEVAEDKRIVNYCLRQQDQKKKAVLALKGLNLRIVAAGDSYNDLTMLLNADAGLFFKPNDKIVEEYPQLPVTRNYEELKTRLIEDHGYPA